MRYSSWYFEGEIGPDPGAISAELLIQACGRGSALQPVPGQWPRSAGVVVVRNGLSSRDDGLPLRDRPDVPRILLPAFGVLPPHCLKKKATFAVRH